MVLIRVPKPSRTSMNPERSANALLLSQVEHLQHAEQSLPVRYRSQIYTRAIRTEGEAANYIREVTEAIHKAHDDAKAERTERKRVKKRTAAREKNAGKPARTR